MIPELAKPFVGLLDYQNMVGLVFKYMTLMGEAEALLKVCDTLVSIPIPCLASSIFVILSEALKCKRDQQGLFLKFYQILIKLYCSVKPGIYLLYPFNFTDFEKM